MIERIFETKIPPDTLRKRAERQLRTNVHSDSTAENHEEKSGNSGNIQPGKIERRIPSVMGKTKG